LEPVPSLAVIFIRLPLRFHYVRADFEGFELIRLGALKGVESSNLYNFSTSSTKTAFPFITA